MRVKRGMVGEGGRQEQRRGEKRGGGRWEREEDDMWDGRQSLTKNNVHKGYYSWVKARGEFDTTRTGCKCAARDG